MQTHTRRVDIYAERRCNLRTHTHTLKKLRAKQDMLWLIQTFNILEALHIRSQSAACKNHSFVGQFIYVYTFNIWWVLVDEFGVVAQPRQNPLTTALDNVRK